MRLYFCSVDPCTCSFAYHPNPPTSNSIKRPIRRIHVRGQGVFLEGGGALVAELSVDGDAVAAHAVDVVVHGQFGRGGVSHVDEAAELGGEGLGLEADVHVVLHALSTSLLHDVACNKQHEESKAQNTLELGLSPQGEQNQ